MWLLTKCGCLPGNCFSAIIFLWWSCSVVGKCSWSSIKTCTSDEVRSQFCSNSVLCSFPEGHLQLLPWSHFVSPCSISVLCAITGCRNQLLKLASLKRPLWKTKHFNDHVYPISRLLYNNFGFSFVDIQELKQHTVLWESKKTEAANFSCSESHSATAISV